MTITCALLTCAVLSPHANGSDALDALGYTFPKHRFSLKNLRPHYDDREKQVIPADEPVPTNWVIVGHRRTLLQIGATSHQLIIQKLPTRPGSELTIWKCQPIPYGWAITEEFTSNQFPGKMNVYRIRRI